MLVLSLWVRQPSSRQPLLVQTYTHNQTSIERVDGSSCVHYMFRIMTTTENYFHISIDAATSVCRRGRVPGSLIVLPAQG